MKGIKKYKMKQLEIIKRAIIYVLYIILIPIIIYDLLLIVQTAINPTVTPSIFGIKTFQIISGSMEPEIKVNDVVIIKSVTQNDIKKGDIITFNIGEETITHRVLKIDYIGNNIIYTTKGDNNEVTDIQKIDYSQIEGKMVTKIPKLGILIMFIQNKVVFVTIIILLIFCYNIQQKSINRKIKRKEKRIKFDKKRLTV